MSDKCRGSLADGLAKFGFGVPTSYHDGAARHQHDQRHRHEQNPKTEMLAVGVPIHDLLGGMGRFVLQRLYVAHEESRHEERCREDEEQFRGGERIAFGLHKYFIYQSTNMRKVKLSPKLPEVMIEMLVRQRRPFHWSERTEERVRMAGKGRRAGGRETID